MTAAMPQPLIAIGACSREEPQPKFLPATITSPGETFAAHSGLTGSRQCRDSSATSVVFR